MVSMITTVRRTGRPAGLESGPQLAVEAAPGQEAGQVGGALGMSGGQNEPQSRVGVQKFLKGVRHQFLFAGMGGGRQPYRPVGLPRFSFSSLQETAKFLEARFVPALEQTVVFQVAGEMAVWREKSPGAETGENQGEIPRRQHHKD